MYKCDARIETPEGFFSLGKIKLPIPPFPGMLIHLDKHRRMNLTTGEVQGEFRIQQVIYSIPHKKLMIIGTNIMESKLREEMKEKEIENEA